MALSLGNLFEELRDTYIAVEAVKAGAFNTPQPAANSSDGYQHVTTGVDSDGKTLVNRQSVVPGVSNGVLVVGGAVLAAATLLAIAVIVD